MSDFQIYADVDFGRLHEILADSALVKKAVWQSLKRSGQNMKTNIARELAKETYLKNSFVKKSVKKPVLKESLSMVSVGVESAETPAFRFKLKPNTVTAKKGTHMREARMPGFKIGPKEPVRYAPQGRGFSKAFNVKNKKGKIVQLHRRESDNELMHVMGPSMQYFASFNRVQETVQTNALEAFQKRLEHEILYRLGLV